MRKQICALALFLAVSACSKSVTDPGSVLHGSVVARFPASGAWIGSLHVKSSTSDVCGVVWSVSKDTKLRKRLSSGATTSATFDDFVVGSIVNVTSTGVIAESCPGQGTAIQLELEAQ